MSRRGIRIGSRGSALARIQADLVIAALARAGVATELVIIETAGDRRAPDTAWGEGAFVAAIGDALLDGRVDVAVHSAKDVPIDQDERLVLAAFLPRADPRDALVVRADAADRRLDDLPTGSRVGTDSPRRTGFARARRPDLVVHPLHGNVDTRLRRLDAGETDALILACAGLDRLGLGDRIAERFEPGVLPPAPGQAAVAVQIRRDDAEVAALAGLVDDADTRLAVEAERAFLEASGGGCRAPIGALATVHGDEIDLFVGLVKPDGSGARRALRRATGSQATAMARAFAQELGATRAGVRVCIPRVLVPRATRQSNELVARLRAAGIDPVEVPAIGIALEPAGGALDLAFAALEHDGWIVVTSANGAEAALAAVERVGAARARFRWAVIGRATADVLARAGIEATFRPSASRAGILADELPVDTGDHVVVVRGNLADADVAVALHARGATVEDVVAYRTEEAPAASRELLRDSLATGSIDAIAFTSGSTVRGLIALGAEVGWDPRTVPAACIGPETARIASDLGFEVRAVAPTPNAAALATATATALAPTSLEIT